LWEKYSVESKWPLRYEGGPLSGIVTQMADRLWALSWNVHVRNICVKEASTRLVTKASLAGTQSEMWCRGSQKPLLANYFNSFYWHRNYHIMQAIHQYQNISIHRAYPYFKMPKQKQILKHSLLV
jgi:hypothetical protein